MSVQSVLLPVFVYVALVLGLLGALVVTRQIASRRQALRDADIAEGRARWEGAAGRVGASYSNQFEMPVLFLALVALALTTHQTSTLFVLLEWIYVALRLAHAAIHVTVNILSLRGAVFAASAAVLGIAWIVFAVAILAG